MHIAKVKCHGVGSYHLTFRRFIVIIAAISYWLFREAQFERVRKLTDLIWSGIASN